MKNILMITPFFAPYSHAAVYRAHRFAKYLPRFGWKPYVLTTGKSFLYFVDPTLLDDLPKEVEIIRARHIDLTFSGLKSLFEKTVTNSRSIKGPMPSDLTAGLQNEGKEDFLRTAIDKIRDGIIFLPDRYITWYPFALKKAEEIIGSNHIGVIYSTALPFTSHLIAMKLKKRFGIPWIADFRDPGVEERTAKFQSTRFKYKVNCKIEKAVMKEADFIVTLSEDARNLFLSKYKEIVDNKIICIRTGTDVEILQNATLRKRSKKFTVVFTGEFLQEYNRKFFELLKVIFERKLFEKSNIEILIIGSIKRNISLKKEIELLGLTDAVKLIDFLFLSEYFSVLLSADAVFLPGVLKRTFPIKLTDYLFIKKPIIAFDINDEIRGVLEKSGLGIFVPDETEAGINTLLNLFRGDYKLNINEDYINQFTAFNQTKELVEIFKRLI